MKGDDLYKERDHIKFWDNCLNDLKKQFEIMSNYLDLIRKIKVQRMTELESIISKYKTNIIPYSKEPSHLYSLNEIYFDFLSYLWEVINKFNDELYSKINSMNLEIIKDLDIKKSNLYKDNISLIDECQLLINEIKTQENEFNKKKELMNEAQINRNKIKNQVQNIYNVSENKKADLLLAKSIKKMEEIKIPMEENKKKLKEYKASLIASFSLIFENYFSIYFKHLAILYQYFYLLENNKINILSNMQKQLKGILLQISNLSFELNDYTEKKFGETLNINYDGLILLDSEEFIKKANSTSLLKISKDVINYVKVFFICLKYRKKISKHFYETLKLIYKLELNIQSENEDSYNNILNQLKSIKHTSEGTFKRWNGLISTLKSGGENKNYELLISWIEEYINFVSNEIDEFKLAWKEYENKIIEKQNMTKENIKEINNNNMKKRNGDVKIEEFREIIRESIKFIKSNIINIRIKDKTKIQNLSSSFEKLIIKYKNEINKTIDYAEVQLSILANLDIFEESKVIIIKYFNNVKIKNYLGFLEKMKYKLLSQFQIEETNDTNEKEKEIEMEELKENNNIFSSDKNTINSKDFEEEDSQSQILQENSRKNLNLLFKDSRKFLFETNQKNILNRIPTKDSNENNKIIQENNSLENNSKDFDNISLDLLNRNKFTELTKIENPYKNIKEDELKKLKEINTNINNEDELEKGENIIDKFNCALKDKILLQGKFFITNKRIWFSSLFNTSTLFGKTTIMIPLTDIVSIEKKPYLALDNSIEVKTEKVSYFFTNYLSRDNCFNLLQEELNKIEQKKSHKSILTGKSKKLFSENKKSITSLDDNPNKRLIKISPIFSKILNNFDFSKKLNLITQERMNIIIKKFRNEKNLTFLSEEKNFPEKIFEHVFNSCPLFICFKYICKASTQLDELVYKKGFFESILIQNFSKDVIMIEKENDDIESWEIPNYFVDEDYVLNLFSSYEKQNFENLLNESRNWIYKYEYNCYGMNKKIKKNSKSDLYTVYFLSPTLLILDVIHYSSNDNFINNYIPIFRYKFDSNIKFNEKKGKFDIETKLTVLLDIFFSMNCILSNEERNKIYKKYKEKFRDWVLGKLIDVLNNYSNDFKHNYEKISEENLNKKFNINNENIIFDSNNKDFENNIIENIDNDFEELEKNNIIDDINTIQSIEINNIKITNENNYIKNINLLNTSSNNNKENISNFETNVNKEELDSQQKQSKKDTNLIKNIQSKIKINKINIILVLIIILILITFLLSFLKSEKILINIINLICLGLTLFLLIQR